ncbi:MAG: hypothetical protein Q8P23_03000 [bacterium]|nr:hypothetical protein [bacterium]
MEFFDDPLVAGHASAIVGMIGEELNAAAFKHYVESRGAKAEILHGQNGKTVGVTQGTKKGKRLDRWIEIEEKGKKTLYQCEIKNWSATAIGGKRLEPEADTDTIRNVSKYYWSHQVRTEFSNRKYPSGVTKVLVKMKLLSGFSKAHPLLIYWMPISKSDSDSVEPFFEVSVSSFKNTAIKTEFKKLYIFSVSLYFRMLLKNGKKFVNFDMPESQHRISILRNIGIV